MLTNKDFEIIDTLSRLEKEINESATKKGFWDDFQAHTHCETGRRALVSEKIALIASEVSEALDAFRQPELKADEHCNIFLNVEVELADAIIRILDLGAQMRWNVPGALMAKKKFNEGRPRLHGKRF